MNVTAVAEAIKHEHTRTGLKAEHLKRAFVDNMIYEQGRYPGRATTLDYYLAIASAVRDRLVQRWVNTIQTYVEQDARVVCYFSAEFLLGPHLGNNLLNLGIEQQARQAMQELGLDVEAILDEEQEPGLGNGGLGRLAACYLDSLSTLSIPAVGYGIRYEYGIFKQEIRDGWQVELTDKWLQFGNPWELERPERAVNVSFGGRTEAWTDEHGKYRVRWIPDRMVKAIPYDTPISGYHARTTNTIRLWSAEATEAFDLAAFNVGDYLGAVRAKIDSETISQILYPNDENPHGKQLRLEQQYFFVSASLQDMIRLHLGRGRKIED